jgi:hypothetical protein
MHFVVPSTSNFNNKIKKLRKLLQITCVDYPEQLKIGNILLSKGSQLAERRNVAVHWPASRVSSSSLSQIQFVDLAWESRGRHVWRLTEIVELASDIAHWWMDLNRFSVSLTLGPLASRTMFNGPLPTWAAPLPENFQTIEKGLKSRPT